MHRPINEANAPEGIAYAGSVVNATDTSAGWNDLSQVVLFGGYRGGGVEMSRAPTAGAGQPERVWIPVLGIAQKAVWSRSAME